MVPVLSPLLKVAARAAAALLLAAVALLLPASPGRAASGDALPARPTVVLGASVSRGFGVRLRTPPLPDGRRVTAGVDFADMLRAASRDPGLQVEDLSTELFFRDPESFSTSSVQRAVERRPSLVLAVDWMFWSAYGREPAGEERERTCADRVRIFRAALERLEPLVAIGVPVVIGDVPDMHAAIDGGMLSAPMVPSPDCIDRLNGLLRDWASRHRNVAIVPLHDIVRRAHAGEVVKAGNRDWNPAELGPMLQKDRLHPTLVGSMALLAAALQAADSAAPVRVSDRFDLDPTRLKASLLARIAADSVSPEPAPAEPPAAGDS